MNDYKLLINGDLVTTDQVQEVINPATEKVFTQVPRASEDTVDEAVVGARRAAQKWKATPLSERRALLHQIADRIHDNIERIARVLIQEQGKPLMAATLEVQYAESFCRYFAEQALPVEVLEENDQQRIEIHRRPLGVVAGIVPWNFPFLIAVYKLAPALLVGNSIIIKPAPTTPVTAVILGELIADIVPSGLVNILVDNNDLGPKLSQHPGVAKVSFTGSTPTGKAIMASVAPTLKRLSLELGGNDAAIVLDDVDVKVAAPGIFSAAFMNSGQVCIALKRLYVHESIYDDMCEELAALARQAIVGDGMDPSSEFGPVQNSMQYQKVLGYIEDAKKNGQVIAGGEISEAPGYFVPLTIVRNVTDGARVVDEEPFGPVLPVIKYADVDDVIARANNTPYGLGGSVWSADLARAHTVATQLESGTVWINQHGASGPHIPFPTAKESGLGVELGREGLLEFTDMQVVNINKQF